MNGIKTFLAGGLALFSLFAHAGQNAFDEIAQLDSMARTQADAFVDGLEEAAASGSQEAAFTLRHLYSLEFLPGGSEKSEFYSPEKAHQWNMELIRLSSDKYPYKYRAGLDFFKGFGVKPDAKMAVMYFEDVAKVFLDKKKFGTGELNSDSITSPLCVSMKAAACLAYCLENGIGANRDFVRAKEISDKIISMGNPAYLGAVAEIFCPFFGRPSEFAEDASAYKKYAESAKISHKKRDPHGDNVEDEIKKYSDMAKEKLEASDNPIARVVLAKKLLALEEKEIASYDMFYMILKIKYGLCDEQNMPLAVKILEAETAKGNPFAALELGNLYARGNAELHCLTVANMPFDFNPEKAAEYYSVAIQNDNSFFAAKALEGLGDLALGVSHGNDENLGMQPLVPNARNIKQAMSNYLQSARLGNIGAMAKLGDIYNGIAVGPGKFLWQPDEMASVYWLERTAKKDAKSACRLGKMFLKGYPLKRNLKKAAELFESAMNFRNSVSSIEASEIYAAMCESGMIDGKSQKDAMKIRSEMVVGDSKTAFALYEIYLDGTFKNNTRKSDLEIMLSNLSKRENGIIGTEAISSEPSYAQWQLEDIERLKSGCNSADPRVQYVIGHLYKSVMPKLRSAPNKATQSAMERIREACSLAAEYFKKSAEGGYLPSHQALSSLYLGNMYADRDIEKSLYWCDLGIKKGDERSVTFNNILRFKTFRNQIEALKKEALAGNRYSQGWLVSMLKFESLIDNPEKYFEDLLFAQKYSDGNGISIRMAILKLAGVGTEKDVNGAVSILEEVAKSPCDRADAAMLLAHVYSGREEGFPRNEKRYVKYLNMMSGSEYAVVPFLIDMSYIRPKFAVLAESIKIISKEGGNLLVQSYFDAPSTDMPLDKLEKLAAEGDNEAKYFAALKCATCDSADLDYKKAAKYIRELVEKDPENMKYLHVLWYLTENGLGGIEKDEKLADTYLDRLFVAAENGDYDAGGAISNLLGERMTAYLFPEKISEKLCGRAMELAAINDNALFQHTGGILKNMLGVYSQFRGTEKSDEILEMLIKRDRKEDYVGIAWYCMIRKNPPEYDRAFQYYEKAWSTSEFKYFATDYGKLCFYGLGTERNYKKAFELFSSIDDQPEALIWTMLCHEKGYGTEKNPEKAKECFDKALKLAVSGDDMENNMFIFFNSATQMMTGKTYDVTLGLPKEPEIGKRLIQAAADAGYEYAQEYMKKNGI